MANTGRAHGWHRTRSESVWGSTKIVFLGSLLVFLINIGLGFLNVFTPGEIPHWQILTHLHGGTLGWLTLSVVGFTIWLFTGNREVSATYETRVRYLAWVAVIAGAGYVLSFGIAFYATGNAYYLMPVFGTAMLLVIWSTALLAWSQLRDQPVVRTVHLLAAGGLLVASLGAIMGVLLGLQYAVGSLPLPDAIPDTSNHAAPMDIYALILGSALVEWLVDRDEVADWTWPGAFQAGVWTLAGVLAFVPVEAVSGIGALAGFMGGTLIFLVRMGWRAVIHDPRTHTESTWAMLAPIYAAIFVGGFFIAMSSGGGENLPDWMVPVLFHAYFVGFLTNSILGMYSGRTRNARSLHEYAEPAAFWLLNIGLIVFWATEIAMGSKHGAIVMGLGVLLAVAEMGYGLLGDGTGDALPG